jgi:hypothetical protein
LSKNKIEEKPVRIIYHNIATSLVDHGYGTVACISIRKIDAEGKNVDISTAAQLGVLGRLVTGARIALFEVLYFYDSKILPD